MKKLLIIKLGGSVITNKDSQKPEAKLKVIKRLGTEINQLYKQGYKLIIVHGAGSYAHPLVKKYNLHLGVASAAKQQILTKVHQQLMELNQLVIDSLTNNGTPAISFPPRFLIKQKNGRLLSFDYFPIKQAIENDLVPVLFGDMVPDDNLGYSVISGDTIVPYLTKKLKAEKVIFLSDVDGIYTADPKVHSEAKLIPEINDKNFAQVIQGLTSGKRNDVTGEMKGKLMSLRHDLRKVPVVVVNGLKARILQKVLRQTSIGTKLFLN